MSPKSRKQKPFSPAADDVRSLFALVMKNDPEVGTGAALLIATGMRRGELLALFWSDINWAHEELHVNKSLSDGGRGVGVVVKSTTAEGIAEAQVRFPTVPIVFAETRPLAQEWTYRFLGAALAHHAQHHQTGLGPVPLLPLAGPIAPREPSVADVRAWALTAGLGRRRERSTTRRHPNRLRPCPSVRFSVGTQTGRPSATTHCWWPLKSDEVAVHDRKHREEGAELVTDQVGRRTSAGCRSRASRSPARRAPRRHPMSPPTDRLSPTGRQRGRTRGR